MSLRTQRRPLAQVTGPAEPFDINVDHQTFLNLAAWKEQYGDVVGVAPHRRNSPALFLNDPNHVRHILIGNHRNYRKGVGFERVAMLLGNGIIVSDGEFWRAQRRMIQPVFHKSVIAAQAKMMHSCNKRKLEQWQSRAADSIPVDITLEMSELALEVILRALISNDLDRLIETEGGNPFALLVEDVTRDLQLAMRFRSLTRHIAKIIHNRREVNRVEDDFLSYLMQARDKDTGEAMPDKHLIDEVMTIIVAGHETTAGTLNWAWYLLSQHPEIEKTLHEEVDRLGRDPAYEDLAQLQITRQIIEETLRLYPPVWLFSRKAINDDRLPQGDHDIHVQAGTDIFLCPYLLHRDERYWPDPERFRPARFSDEMVRDRNKCVYFPFSLGSRRCIGEFFSLVDMQLHIAMLAQHICLRHVPGDAIEIEPLINLRSRNSIMMMPMKRHP
ncbi:MAG: cytochrome P450 [Granulosicoccus sp.]